MSHTQLVSAALVGSSDEKLLDKAAQYAAVRHATVPTTEIAPGQPAPPLDPNIASQRVTSLIKMFLGKSPTQRDEMVCETLELMTKAGMVLPASILVPLLEISQFSKPIATALPPVLGARGRWLVAQNKNWLSKQATDQPVARHWDEGTQAERVAWLRQLRSVDPAAGRELVISAGKEKASDRVEFVAALEVGLSLDDEEFLESLLAGRARTVAASAALLLAKLPGSQLLQRAEKQAQGLFSYKKGFLRKASIEAIAPEPGVGEEDHWEWIAQNDSLIGERGAPARLRNLVSLINPSSWQQLSGVDPTQLLGEVHLDGDRIQLGDAIACAVQRFGDAETARNLLGILPNPQLLAALPPNERLSSAVAISSKIPNDYIGLLDEYLDVDIWPAELISALYTRLRLKNNGKEPWRTVIYEMIAKHIHPGQAEDLIIALNATARTESDDSRAAARAVQNITLRKTIYDAIYYEEKR